MRIRGQGRKGIRRGGLGMLTTAIVLGAIVPGAHAAISISGPAPVGEGAANATLTYTIARSGCFCGAARVVFRTTGGTATAGADYTGEPGVTVELPGSVFGTSVAVGVRVLDDALHEGATNETVVAALDSPQGDSISASASTAKGEIVDDDPAPSVSIAPAQALEGTGAAGSVGLPVDLSAASGLPVSVPYVVEAGTAAVPEDVDGTPGTVTIPAGQTGGTIPVATVGDAIDEPDETFSVVLGTPTNATKGTERAVGTVLNDDTPTVFIAGVTSAEGTSADTTPFAFPVWLSNASVRSLRVRVRTADGTAASPGDYAAVDQVVTFAPGELTKTFTVPVVADAVDEPDETFTASLSEPVGLHVGATTAFGVIVDDDPPPAPAATPGGGTGTTPGRAPAGGGSASGGPPAGTPTTGSPGDPPAPAPRDRTRPRVSMSGLAVHRRTSLRLRVTCPTSETRCTGLASVFSVPLRKARNRILRREVRLGTASYTLRGGQARTLTVKVTRAGRLRLGAVKRLAVRAYGVTTDAAGNVGVRRISATLRR